MTKARAGLIPAHAGKTEACGPKVNVSQAHPRSRGENDGNGSVRALSAGSSPLTRGKHQQNLVKTLGPRLIPAHAGKTSAPSLASSPTTAHPRSRGENVWWPRPDDGATGSSPLTRGKHTDQ